MDKKEIGYSEAVREVEEILARLSGSDIDIDRLAAEVRRAGELIALCKARLHRAEEDIAAIVSKQD